MGFEPTRAEHIGLAVQRLNHSATSSVNEHNVNVVSSCMKHVLETYVQSVVTVWFYVMKSGLKYLEIRQRSRHQYVYIMNTVKHGCLIWNFFPVFNFISH